MLSVQVTTLIKGEAMGLCKKKPIPNYVERKPEL